MNVPATVAALLERSEALAYVAMAIVALFLLVCTSALGLFLHHYSSQMRRELLNKRMAIATDIVAPAVGSPERIEETLEEAVERSLKRVGQRATAAVLRQFRARLAGDVAELLSHHLERVGEVERLGKLATSRRAWLRRAAARGLGECGGRKAVAHLVWLLSDKDPEVRRTARHSLLASENSQGIHVAIRSYFEDLAVHRGWKAAFYARLAAVAPEQLRELLERNQLKGTEEKLALEALGDVRDALSASLAGARLDSADAELRATAVRVLGKLRRTEHRERILRDLTDPAWFVRAAAARALETLGPDGAADDGLLRALRDPEWWVRANAARALARRGDGGIRHLVTALEADDHYARDAALAALTSAGALGRLVDRLRRLAEADPADPVLAGLLSRAEAGRA